MRACMTWREIRRRSTSPPHSSRKADGRCIPLARGPMTCPCTIVRPLRHGLLDHRLGSTVPDKIKFVLLKIVAVPFDPDRYFPAAGLTCVELSGPAWSTILQGIASDAQSIDAVSSINECEFAWTTARELVIPVQSDLGESLRRRFRCWHPVCDRLVPPLHVLNHNVCVGHRLFLLAGDTNQNATGDCSELNHQVILCRFRRCRMTAD